MSEYKNRGFLIKQRGVLKLYIMSYIINGKSYGLQMLEDLREEFKDHGYYPTHSEIYKTLHELTREGSVKRERRIKGNPQTDFQEIILYHLTEQGREDYILYKKQIKKELDRCIGLLQKTIGDHY